MAIEFAKMLSQKTYYPRVLEVSDSTERGCRQFLPRLKPWVSLAEKHHDIADRESDLSPLEIDAYAVEMLEMASRNQGRLGLGRSWKEVGYSDPEMEYLCTAQAKALSQLDNY